MERNMEHLQKKETHETHEITEDFFQTMPTNNMKRKAE